MTRVVLLISREMDQSEIDSKKFGSKKMNFSSRVHLDDFSWRQTRRALKSNVAKCIDVLALTVLIDPPWKQIFVFIFDVYQHDQWSMICLFATLVCLSPVEHVFAFSDAMKSLDARWLSFARSSSPLTITRRSTPSFLS